MSDEKQNISSNTFDNRRLFILWLLLTSFLALALIYLVIINPQNALLAVIILSAAIIFFKRPDLGIFIALFSLLPGQLLTIHLGSDTAILISDIIIPPLFFLWLFKKLVKKEKLSQNLIAPALFLFLAVALISFCNGLRYLDDRQDILPSFFYLIRLISYAGLFFITANEFKSEKRINNFKKVILIIFFIFAIFGLGQVIISPNMGELALKAGWDPHVGRLFSTLLDPNFAGAFLVFGLIISLSLFLYGRTIESKIITSSVAILTLIGIILTYSRSSYLFLAVSFFILAIAKSRRLLLFGIVIIIALLIIFPRSLDRIQGGFDIDASAKLRFSSWGNSLSIVRDHPILGVGYNAFRPAQIDYGFIKKYGIVHSGAGSDSSILTILATTGVIGLIAYLLFYLSALIKAKNVFNFSPSEQRKALALATLSLLVGLIFHSIFVNSLFYPALMAPLFILMGVISAEPEQSG